MKTVSDSYCDAEASTRISKDSPEGSVDLALTLAPSITVKTKPNADIITLDSFADEINKRKIKLNYLQMSCFNYRYCINEDLHALDINKIEQDLNDFKEDEIYQYHS